MAGRRQGISKRELRRRKIRRRRRLVLALFVCLLLVIAWLVYQLFFASPVRSSVRWEVGDSTPTVSLFLKKENPNATMLTHMGNLNLREPGKYPVEIQIGTKTYTPTLQVVDTQPPEGTALDQTAILNTQLDAASFVTNIQDATAVTVSYKQRPDFSKEGRQQVDLILKDAGGNTTELSAALILEKDTIAPVIEGAQDLYILTGTKHPDYTSNITVSDNHDINMEVAVDDSRVDLKTPGNYMLYYSAVDMAGNLAQTSVTIHVVDQMPEAETGADGNTDGENGSGDGSGNSDSEDTGSGDFAGADSADDSNSDGE